MTLLKPVEVDEKLNNQDMMKMEKFMQLVKDTCNFFNGFHNDLICLAAGNGKCNNPYVKFVVEYVFSCKFYFGSGGFLFGGGSYSEIPFNCSEQHVHKSYKDNFYSCLRDKRSFKVWRDDIELFRNNPQSFSLMLDIHLRKISNFSSEGANLYKETIDEMVFKHEVFHECWYMIFWNLFLTAIDDEIYNNQLADVIDLAYMFKFDEPMIRDWCHTVEYVLRGNKLGKDCDLEVETVEGDVFFKSKL